CLVALATTAFWTSLLEPIMTRDRKVRGYEVFLGLVMIGAISWIFQGGFEHVTGFLVGIGSALAGTIFSILNGRYAPKYHHWVITFYEMSGAALFCLLCLPLSATFFTNGGGVDLLPSPLEWVWLLVLVIACTIYAYSEYVELLKRLSVFTINLAYNLEPVYGIVLAAVLFAEHEELGSRFYLGAAIIIGAVVAHPFLERASQKQA
ncbi:MAG: DMT family transporter, partial [Verrucomicrobiota bacterium]